MLVTLPSAPTVILGTVVALPYVPAVTPVSGLMLTLVMFVTTPLSLTVTCATLSASPYTPAVAPDAGNDISPDVLS